MPGILLGPWHGDEVSKETLRFLASGFSGFTKYPPVHYYVLAIADAPYLALLWLTGGIDTSAQSIHDAFRDPLSSMTVVILIARVVAALMSAAAVLVVYRILRRQTVGQWPALFGAACLALFPEWVLFSHMTTVDLPMMFWFALALSSLLQYVGSGSVRHAWRLGVLVAVSASTKEQIAGAWVLTGVLLVVYQWRRRSTAPPLRGLVWAAVSFLVVYVLLNRILTDPQAYWDRMQYWFEEGANPDRWGGQASTIAGHVSLLAETAWRTGMAGGWPLVVVCLGLWLVALVRRDRTAWVVAVVAVSYYVFTIATIRYVYTRFTLPLLLLLALGGALGLSHTRSWRTLHRGLVLAGTLALGLSLVRGVQIDLAFGKDPRLRAEQWIRDHLPEGCRVESYAYDHYHPRLRHMKGIDWASIPRDGMRVAAFQERRPAAAVLAPAFWFHYTGRARRFQKWLVNNSGYELHRFEASDCDFLPRDEQNRIQPACLVLVDPDQ